MSGNITGSTCYILRNTALGNFLDRCAISIPCHRPGDAPVGLMLMGETMGDARLFRIAAAVEKGRSLMRALHARTCVLRLGAVVPLDDQQIRDTLCRSRNAFAA